MRFHQCHCCGGTLLRHASARGLYWYCSSCRQEMLPVTLNVKTVLDLPDRLYPIAIPSSATRCHPLSRSSP